MLHVGRVAATPGRKIAYACNVFEIRTKIPEVREGVNIPLLIWSVVYCPSGLGGRNMNLVDFVLGIG